MGCAYLNKAEHALATAIEAGTCMPVSMGGVERLGAREVEVFRMNADEPALDWVAEEVPVALVYNGISHAVMMASPSMLEEFALGFSLAEGIIPDASHLYACEVREACRGGIEVDLTISSECFWKLKDRRRSMTGRTGCGICGVESLGEAVREKRVVPHEQTFPMAAYADALGYLVRVERLGGITGCTHAAVWVRPDGSFAGGAEDVGRHVALDKLLGLRARRGWREARLSSAPEPPTKWFRRRPCAASRSSSPSPHRRRSPSNLHESAGSHLRPSAVVAAPTSTPIPSASLGSERKRAKTEQVVLECLPVFPFSPEGLLTGGGLVSRSSASFSSVVVRRRRYPAGQTPLDYGESN